MIRFALAVAVMLLRGFVTKVLWGWFFVPLGVPAVSIAGAMGASTLISYLTKQLDPDKPTDPDLGGAIALEVSWAVVALVAGWIFHFWA